jgi:hypothetical protein
MLLPCARSTYLAAADHEYLLVADLPRKNERATALDLGVGALHDGAERRIRSVKVRVVEK